ncbi:MAG: FtsX-like permease family protein [Pseudomonadota bacterium]
MNIKYLLHSLMRRKFVTLLLVLQLALTIGLLCNSVILTLDVNRQLQFETGIQADAYVVVSVSAIGKRWKEKPDIDADLQQKDFEAIKNIDDVFSVAVYNQTPLSHADSKATIEMQIPGAKNPALQSIAMVTTDLQGLDNFDLAIIEGRGFTVADKKLANTDSDNTVIVTQALADFLMPNASIIGQLTNRGRVIGVSENIMYNPKAHGSAKYFAHFVYQDALVFSGRKYYILKVNPQAIPRIKKTLAARLKDTPDRVITNIYTLKDEHTDFFANEVGTSKLFVALCGLMLLVALVSSFAHAHFHVTKQIHLIGIRRALGARKSDILRYVLAENLLISLSAFIPGLLCALAMNIQLNQFLNLSKPHWIEFVSIYGIILLTGLVASWLPAYRTAQIPPIAATKTS